MAGKRSTMHHHQSGLALLAWLHILFAKLCQEYPIVDVVKEGFVNACTTIIRVQKRLSSPDGMDLAELLYQTMQAYDFAYLYSNKAVNTQVSMQTTIS